jgi:hypothetical protein
MRALRHVPSSADREVLREKQESRENDRRLVETGLVTALEVSLSNSIATSVIEFYRPVKKLRAAR